jgi:hypothetical protein
MLAHQHPKFDKPGRDDNDVLAHTHTHSHADPDRHAYRIECSDHNLQHRGNSGDFRGRRLEGRYFDHKLEPGRRWGLVGSDNHKHFLIDGRRRTDGMRAGNDWSSGQGIDVDLLV